MESVYAMQWKKGESVHEIKAIRNSRKRQMHIPHAFFASAIVAHGDAASATKAQV
ncbi:MAG TPA: hypothetical protein PKD41_09065 [Solidesulfovibrio sp.]|nr:hypothetical protein [Solidesulfovibrio sp.]